jgi:hypothetical protein
MTGLDAAPGEMPVAHALRVKQVATVVELATMTSMAAASWARIRSFSPDWWTEARPLWKSSDPKLTASARARLVAR